MKEVQLQQRPVRGPPSSAVIGPDTGLLEGADAIAASEACFRAAVSNSQLILATCDANLRYTWIYNPAAPYTPESALGRRDDELSDPQNVRQLVSLKEEVLATGRVVRRDVAVVVDGRRRYYDITAEPMVCDTGAIIGVATAAADVTDSRRREWQRLRLLASERRARARTEAAIRARDAVVNVVSHDLRSPLATIQMAADLLRNEEGRDPERQRRAHDALQNSVDHMFVPAAARPA